MCGGELQQRRYCAAGRRLWRRRCVLPPVRCAPRFCSAQATFGKDIAIAFSGAEDVALIEYAHLTGRPYRVFRCVLRRTLRCALRCPLCCVGPMPVPSPSRLQPLHWPAIHCSPPHLPRAGPAPPGHAPPALRPEKAGKLCPCPAPAPRSLDTGRLNPETYRLFDAVEKHYKIRIEYTFPEAQVGGAGRGPWGARAAGLGRGLRKVT